MTGQIDSEPARKMRDTTINMKTVADLAMELVWSAYGRGQDDAGPDDKAIDMEKRAIFAIRAGNVKAIERSLVALQKKHADELAALERLYGGRP